MDGVAALRTVLVADAALGALVADAKVLAGPLPVGTVPPAISLQSVSKNDRNIPAPGLKRFVTERVQATVIAANYPSQKAIMRAIRHAAADRLNPTVTGIENVTIHTESAGPDFMNEEASLYLGTQDFRVRYLETR